MCRHRCPATTRNLQCTSRGGISLLELVLALAILGASMAVLAQIATRGTDAAHEASDLAAARIICQRKMSEVLLDSFVTPVSVPETAVEPFDSQSPSTFVYSVQVQPGQLSGLLSIRVTVKSLTTTGATPTALYTLDRWMIDPALGLAEMEAEEEAARAESQEGIL